MRLYANEIICCCWTNFCTHTRARVLCTYTHAATYDKDGSKRPADTKKDSNTIQDDAT